MAWLLVPLRPTFEAALRDVRARGIDARVAAAERLAETEEPVSEAAVEHARLALDGLIALARDPQPRVRAAAVRGLRERRDPDALDSLLARLDDEDSLVRELAVVALGDLEGTRARTALVRALRSPHPEVRFQAVASHLDRCEPEEAEASLPLLRDEDPKVRANAARGFARFPALARESLERLLADPEPSVRSEAAIALAKNGDTQSSRQLAEALANPELVVEALDLIGELELRALTPDVASIAESILKPLELKVAAARALVRLGDPNGLGAASLQRALRAFRSVGRSYAVEVVGELKLHAFGNDLARLARRRRGVDLETLVEALRAIANESEPARSALERLSARDDATGAQARRALSGPG